MTNLVRNTCAMTAPLPSPAERIELIPVGAFRTADNRQDFRLDDPTAVIADSFRLAAGGKLLPIDFDHRTFADQGSADSRAAGWITALEVEGDRIMASVEWTAEGRQALEGRAYRFVSPVFRNRPDGQVVLIEGAGLVNNPALPQLRQLASKEPQMDLAKEVGGKLGLPADQPAQIVARIVTLLSAETQLTSILAAAKVSGDDATRQVCARLIAPAADPAQFVPKVSFDELQTQFASLQKTVTDGKVEAALEAARAAGKLTPDLESWATQLASKDLAEFQAWEKVAPVRVDLSRRQQAHRQAPPATEITELTSEQRQVAAQLGIPADRFLASLKADAKEKEEAR